MDHLTFAPTTGQFFLWTSDEAGTRSILALKLAAAGWPGAAQIVRGEALSGPVEGTLIELLDALPILAVADEGAPNPEMEMWARAARLALDLGERGQLVPRLRGRRARGGSLGSAERGGRSTAEPPLKDERIVGWEGRWCAVLATAAERAEVSRIAALAGEIALPLVRPVAGPLAVSAQGRLALPGEALSALPREGGRAPLPGHPGGYSGVGLLRRFLDVAADTLVREASRRGAYVRLGGWPADTWEQRLVRALVDDRAGFWPGELDVAELSRQLKAWTDDQAQSPALLPSPPAWQAGESLQRVVERMVAPARHLAGRLLAGEPAPRTLAPPPTTMARSRMNQAIAVTRALSQRVASVRPEGEAAGQGQGDGSQQPQGERRRRAASG